MTLITKCHAHRNSLLFEPTVHTLLDFNIHLKPMSMQCIFELTEDVEVTSGHIWTMEETAFNFNRCSFVALAVSSLALSCNRLTLQENLLWCFDLIAFLSFLNAHNTTEHCLQLHAPGIP
ncbi:hypothetical protein AVEN_271815-1 [Araneus ventricosus]|uniref:Uncharacterized protein n=1 Tax=Araneus ventricosus TaxID=182803 RepID=A0A4Y2WDC9_ARAVE|nr:hypothetical protein AVEN_271815-1 [Araneus ventricosus]